jgi:predicted ATPase
MQLTRLTIENLRAIEHLDLDLSNSAGGPRSRIVLLGANGAGKTTILDAIAHVYQSLAADQELGARLLSAADVRSTGPSEGALDQAPRQANITIEAMLSADEHWAIRRSLPNAPAHGPAGFAIGDELSKILGKGRTFISDGSISFRDTAHAALVSSSAPCVLLPANRGALEDDVTFSFQELTSFAPRIGCLRKSRERFAPLTARLTLAFASGERMDPGGSVARMWKVLSKYFPELPKPIDVREMRLWFENSDGSVVPLSALSDGERAVLLLFGEIALRGPKDSIVLVDEVEQHLHPEWQHAVLDGLPALMPTTQFIFATQSPYVAACAPDDIIKVGGWKHHGG